MIGIGLIGPIASGKDTICNLICRKSYEERLVISQEFNTSVKVSKVLAEMGIFNPDRFMKQKAGMMIDSFNSTNSGIVDALWPEVFKSKVHLKVINSIRSESQVKKWKELWNCNYTEEFLLLYIDTTEKVRWQRNNQRRVFLGFEPISQKEFSREHKAEIDHDLLRLKKYSTFSINNNGSEHDLKKQVKELLRNLFPYEKAPNI
jgi:dephospho-CoA kinase